MSEWIEEYSFGQGGMGFRCRGCLADDYYGGDVVHEPDCPSRGGLNAEAARKVATIIGTADGGCSFCAGGLAEKMAALFPEHDWNELMKIRDGDEAMAELGYIRGPTNESGDLTWVPS